MVKVIEYDNDGRGECWEVERHGEVVCVAESMDNAMSYAYRLATKNEEDIVVRTVASYYKQEREGTL